MRFAFFGYDYSIDLVGELLKRGHEPLAMFTFPCDQVFAYTVQTYALADSLSVPITDKAVNAEHIRALLAIGCEAFLSAGYLWKIPPVGPAYGINIHPAFLPFARGITPGPYVLLQEPQAAGFTIHKLAPEYDAGDILYQEAFSLDERTDIEIYSARVALRSTAIIGEIFDGLPAYWAKAVPQDERKASSYPAVTKAMRTLDWSDTAAVLRRKAGAYGRFGMLAEIVNNEGVRQTLAVFQSSAWEEAHTHPAGRLMRSSPREVVVAIRDGYAILKEFQSV
jgi:methionyl-tRNA formyltransferase